MEIHQIRYFLAVAETENFTRAAEKNRVAQPSLSQQIINLEKELGHKLFHRLGRRAVLTEAGATFFARARRIIEEIDDAARELSDAPDLGRRIVVGAIPTVAPYLLPQLVDRCRTQFPHLVIHTREDFRSQLVKSVVDGDLDLALVSLPVKDPRLSVEPLFTEPLLLAVHPEHPFAQAESVTANDLTEQTFILLGDSSSLTMQIQRFCGDHHIEPKIGHRCSQIATVKNLVSQNLGISILPQVCRSQEDRGRILYKRLSGREPEREVAILRHLQRYQTRGAEQFLSALRQGFEKTGT